MPRFSLTLVVIYTLLVVTSTIPLAAQQPAETPTPSEPASESSQEKKDMKEAIADLSSNGDMPEFDPVQAEKERDRIQDQRKGWSTKDKLFLAGFIVGIAALVFLVIKYGKKCLRTSPPNCNLGIDEFCYCEEYERRNP